jgi:hypothetical protein
MHAPRPRRTSLHTTHGSPTSASRKEFVPFASVCGPATSTRTSKQALCQPVDRSARFHLVSSIHNEQQKKESKKGGGAGYRSLCLLHAKQALYHLSYTPIDYEYCDCSCSTLILLLFFFLHSSLETHMDSLPVHHTSAVAMFPSPPFPTHLATYAYVSDTETCGCPLPLVLLPRSLVG